MPRPRRAKVTRSAAQLIGASRIVDVSDAAPPHDSVVARDGSQFMPRSGRQTRGITRLATTLSTPAGEVTTQKYRVQSVGRTARNHAVSQIRTGTNTASFSDEESSGTIYGISSSPEVEIGRRAVVREKPVQTKNGMAESAKHLGAQIRSQQMNNGLVPAVSTGKEVEVLETTRPSDDEEHPCTSPKYISDLEIENLRTAAKGASPVGPFPPLAQPTSAFKFGTLRRQKRQPSILGTMRRPLAGSQTTQAHENEHEKPDNDVDRGLEEDFDPEDASTPLHSSGKHVDKRGLLQPESSSLMQRKRKRSPSLAQAPPPSPARSLTTSHRGLVSGSSETPDIDSQDESDIVEPFSETMAPPRSSSSPIRRPGTAISQWQQKQHVTRSSRRAARHATPLSGHGSDVPSSPPSLIHSPNYEADLRNRTRRGRGPQPDDTTAMATAQLQAMLPSRRRRRGRHGLGLDMDDVHDPIDTSGLASDEDELSTLGGPKRRRGTRELSVPAGLLLKSRSARVNAAQQSSDLTFSKKTYGTLRGRTADKENLANAGHRGAEGTVDDCSGSPDHDESYLENSQELEARIGRELKKAKRKFEVVDKWELDYEEDSGNSSGLWNARL